MFEVACASCQASFEYNVEDYILLCPFCSSGFILDAEEGAKDIIGDHYIIPSVLHRDSVEEIFFEWINERYHKPERIKKEFSILGSYGIMLPYWVISVEAHTFWSGYTPKNDGAKAEKKDLASHFVKEEGRFSRRYRWAILARKSPKEHWGLERLHHPKEGVVVDWEGFPLDETMGKQDEGLKPIYEAKTNYKFEHAHDLTVAGIQTKENAAIARARDQINEYHRRIAKTKISSLYEHRTEIEVIGLHVVHIPFWIVRYTYHPQSFFKYLSTAREKRLLVQGYTKAVLEAELPINAPEKILTNLIICGTLAFISLTLSIFLHPLFYILFVLFQVVVFLSAWKIMTKEKIDPDVVPEKGKFHFG